MNHSKYYAFLADENNIGDFTDADYAFFDKHNLAMYFFAKDEAMRMKHSISYKTSLLMSKFEYKRMLIELCEITKALEMKSIHYIILKGVGISETYPEPFTRIMGDHDILVKPKDFEAAIDVLKELNYIADESSITFKDISLYKEGHLMIELHHALFSIDKESFADRFTDEMWYEPIIMRLDCGTIILPNPEMHFRYITLHMMKHLKGMGFGLRHLLDFKYFALAHGIDLEKHITFFDAIGYGAFYRAISTICHFELKMALKSEVWLYDRQTAFVQILAEYIADIGVFGRDSERINIERHFDRFKSSVKSDNKLTVFFCSLFPGRALLTEHYSYALKNKWLLPIAWGHRFIRMVFSKEMRLKEKLFFFTNDEQNMKAVAYMMKSLGIR